MNLGGNPADSILVSAFRSALLTQFEIICLIFLLLLTAWAALRAQPGPRSPRAARRAPVWREPRARAVLRIGFGLLWLLDGILQAQPQMAGGLPSQVILPSADGSPQWVVHLVTWGANIWEFHPIQAASSAVWIQVGIGLWLIFGVRGWPSRLAGLAGAGWGLIVWIFGEAFGAVFAPGLTVLFGAPGSALIYVIAGFLIFLPERTLASPRAGRFLLALTGAFLLVMAAIQAWPGNGFWHGTLTATTGAASTGAASTGAASTGAASQPGPLTSMIQSMAGTPQPHLFASLVTAFASFTAAHGWGVNLFAVAALVLLGTGFCGAAAVPLGRRYLGMSPRGIARIVMIIGIVFCLADWILIEDFGVFGGLGTDPNSMIPLILVFTAGYCALAPAPAVAPAVEPVPAGALAAEALAAEALAAESASAEPALADAVPARKPGLTAGLRARIATLSGQTIAAAGALGVVLVGVAPMASASVNPNADPIVAEALSGQSAPIDIPAANFTLTSQDGRPVSLASLRGKGVLLTFLDPVCTNDCPVIAAEMRAADTLLGSHAKNVELVAVVANPVYRSIALTDAFTQQEDLGKVPNWLYLTGSVSQLEKVWNAYGVQVEDLPAGAMVAHSDLAYVISPSGRIREELSDDPGPGTSSTQSSYAVLMADAVTQAMSSTP
jgi:cytochrome oxidase Cu insertion factor (SCO1/SenC/PrrC family)